MALLQKAYLGSTPLFRNVAWYDEYAPTINHIATATVTADTAAHTKGAWSQLVASTTGNNSFLFVAVSSLNVSATNTASLLDIGIGASGSETALASNIAVGGASNMVFGFPVKIPSGSRLSARMQSVVTGGRTASVTFFVYDAGNYDLVPTSVDVIGADTANSKGISFSGGSGTWVEATASTSQDYRAVAMQISLHSDDIITLNNGLYDIGIGASGSETAFGTGRFTINNAESVTTSEPRPATFGRKIPAGSRLAVRHPINTNSDRLGFVLIGIP